MMSKQIKGFTLIELLVVIAIIALLMSILMPALRNVRDQAKDAICKQQLQQWGVLYNMYAGDNDGTLMDFTMINGIEWDHAWIILMKPYLGDWDICKCPATVQTWMDVDNYFLYLDPLVAWDFQVVVGIGAEPVYESMFAINGKWAYGSYAKNTFVTNGDAFPATRFASEHSWIYEYCYKNVRVKRVSQIPLFGDGLWMGGWPDAHTEPAETYYHDPENVNIWNIDRHSLSVNMVFLDWSVRKVGLRQLWSLKWSKQTVDDENGISVPAWGNLSVVPDWNDPLQWPEWMRNSKNYDL
jgi:prepilin-type N-terminal cleavage/methylation domain-containing protein/prepilin-type processing-associated H-X9-DG protein